MRTTLKQIGLTDHETTIYLTLLKLNEALASKISEKAKLNRTHTYDILESLIHQGLASYTVKNNRKYFHAAPPERLISYLKEKQRILQQQEQDVARILPKLHQLQGPQSNTTIEIYSGKEGIKTVYEPMLKAKRIYVLGATGKIADILKYYFLHFEREREKRNIRLNILFNEKLRGESIAEERKLVEYRYLPKQYSSPIPTLFYNNRVIIVLWTEPLAILIENKEVADTYRSYFKLLWSISKC